MDRKQYFYDSYIFNSFLLESVQLTWQPSICAVKYLVPLTVSDADQNLLLLTYQPEGDLKIYHEQG